MPHLQTCFLSRHFSCFPTRSLDAAVWISHTSFSSLHPSQHVPPTCQPRSSFDIVLPSFFFFLVLPLQICIRFLFTGEDEKQSRFPVIFQEADSGWRDAQEWQAGWDLFCLDILHENMCLCIYYLLYDCKHYVLLLHSDRFTHGTTTIYLVQGKKRPIYHNVIAHYCIYSDKWDGWFLFRSCSVSPSMTLYTMPVQTEPETMLPAHSCSTVIHWRSVPSGVLYICSWNVLLVHITIKANIIVSHCTVHSTAVSHTLTPCWFMRS